MGQMEENSYGWDVDVMSYTDISKVVKSLGYRDFKNLYYPHPKVALSRGLRPLNCDDDVLKFVKDVKGYEVIELYVDHLLATSIVVEEHINEAINYKSKGKKKSFDEEVVINLEDEYEDGSKDECVEVEDEIEIQDASDDYTEDDNDFEENWIWATVFPQEKVNEFRCNVGTYENVEILDPIMTTEFEVENDDSDILVTLEGSYNDETTRIKFPRFKMSEGDEVVMFELGMESLVRGAKMIVGKLRVSLRNIHVIGLLKIGRTKKREIEMIQGAASEQYSYLRSCVEELRRSNPNSTIIIQCDTNNNGLVLERIYVCLEACKVAFAYTCRPLIGLDACYLKVDHSGQLMDVVGKDENNQIIPIACVVVEVETRDS
ncbi:uncharacterized protein [Cicer arietinum]|uniref:uncharacterized protein n=1 Tax=Cicer arietinum TaxID=3827 RepID=UPI003CC626CE